MFHMVTTQRAFMQTNDIVPSLKILQALFHSIWKLAEDKPSVAVSVVMSHQVIGTFT